MSTEGKYSFLLDKEIDVSSFKLPQVRGGVFWKFQKSAAQGSQTDDSVIFRVVRAAQADDLKILDIR